MANGILVFIEHVDGKINRASYEAIRAAQLIGAQTGQEVAAVVFGQGVAAIAALSIPSAAESSFLISFFFEAMIPLSVA